MRKKASRDRRLSRRDFLRHTSSALAAGTLMGFSGGLSCSVTPEPVNVVLILIDDLGWKDLACYGNPVVETPHIDRLASEGLRFTDAYAACCVCSPTRASILTGKYPARLHLTDWIPGYNPKNRKLIRPDFNQQLLLEEITIAEALKKAGYVSASIGKWHLGGNGFLPQNQGFDLNVGGDHRGQPPSYFAPYRIPGLENAPEGEYLTERLTQEALNFIEENQNRPFFLYLSHYGVHMPLQAPEDLVEKYRKKLKKSPFPMKPVYAAMIEMIDRSVGAILKKLEERKLTRKTAVFFTSDNGGLTLFGITDNRPLRAGKGSPYEGGTRVPLIAWWPGVIRPGSTCTVPVISNDFYPTILEMAGIPPWKQNPTDGKSLVPLLKGKSSLERDSLFWHYPHYHPGGATPYSAIRSGPFKLIEFFEDGRLELYNLAEDIGEANNLIQEMPVLAHDLLEQLRAWRREVNASMPIENPNI